MSYKVKKRNIVVDVFLSIVALIGIAVLLFFVIRFGIYAWNKAGMPEVFQSVEARLFTQKEQAGILQATSADGVCAPCDCKTTEGQILEPAAVTEAKPATEEVNVEACLDAVIERMRVGRDGEDTIRIPENLAMCQAPNNGLDGIGPIESGEFVTFGTFTEDNEYRVWILPNFTVPSINANYSYEYEHNPAGVFNAPFWVFSQLGHWPQGMDKFMVCFDVNEECEMREGLLKELYPNGVPDFNTITVTETEVNKPSSCESVKVGDPVTEPGKCSWCTINYKYPGEVLIVSENPKEYEIGAYVFQYQPEGFKKCIEGQPFMIDPKYQPVWVD